MHVTPNYKRTFTKEIQERIKRNQRMATVPSSEMEQSFYAGKVIGLKQALAIFNILNGDFADVEK